MDIKFTENGLYVWIHVTDTGDVRLYGLGNQEAMEPDPGQAAWYRLVEVQATGAGIRCHHGRKHTGTLPGGTLSYVNHLDGYNAYGRRLDITQASDSLTVTSHLQFFDEIPVVRCWTTLHNRGEAVTIEYVSSFALTGLLGHAANPRDAMARCHIPHNTWFGECQWKAHTLHDLGYDPVQAHASVKRVSLHNTGSWACGEHLPMGALEAASGGFTALWQIETSASWHWELADQGAQLYVQLSGPTWQENGFSTTLACGETFVSVPCAYAAVDGDFEKAVQAITRYRRRVRRQSADNAHPAAIFNDYMNCLWGDPATEKELPLIEAAAKAGCKYYCIDCGWYADGPWWDGVGEWLPSERRFPGGLEALLRRIRGHGMIPGLWLELEVMGVHCPLADKLPDEWFFLRDGKRIIDEGRYQLDFSNPGVVQHANAILDRLVADYGVGYIKMDYNINIGTGTDRDGANMGEGLLRHTRAYLAWLDDVFARYPDLIIENCSSGGMRMEYSHLSRHSLQSVTDQTDYRMIASIACNCPTAVTPEQAAIWSYPLQDGDEEETIFNMVNAILLRVHQSGHLADLSPTCLALVTEGIAYHHAICERLKDGLPFWPIGLSSFRSEYAALGIDCGKTAYLAVWHMGRAEGVVTIPLKWKDAHVRQGYPAGRPRAWSLQDDVLNITLLPGTACVFEINKA